MGANGLIREALAAHDGVVRLAPAWVPRTFSLPGGRLRLRTEDLYSLGAHRGGIDERWLASTVQADNGPETPEDEGLSYIVHKGRRVLLRAAVDERGDELPGPEVMAAHGGWMVLAKLFDNLGPLPHHMHQQEEHARRVGRRSKPEAYYFPPQYNTKENEFPCTFMGLCSGVTKDDVRRCLERWDQGDNGILYLSPAYKLRPGAGWRIDAGILHAPGSLVTYEVQGASDVLAMFQSVCEGRPIPWDLLVKDVPPEFRHDLDYIVDMLDWKANADPEFVRKRFCPPRPVRPEAETLDAGYAEHWIVYSRPDYCAKQLAVLPAREVTLRETAAYGVLAVQGHGMFGKLAIEAPSLIRYGQMTADELFVTAGAAREGVTIRNTSDFEDLVLLKHFGPGNSEAASLLTV